MGKQLPAATFGTGDETYASAPVRVCAAFAEGPCPGGPYLEGEVTAVSEGQWDALIGFEPGHALVEHVSPEDRPRGWRDHGDDHRKGAVRRHRGRLRCQSRNELRSPGSDDEVLATAPAGAGTVDVRVLTPEGETPVREGGYTY